jgi:HNH endonuclease
MMDSCQHWKGKHRKWDGRPVLGDVYAYRIAYEAKHGKLEPGQILHHRCGHDWCVNPDHLMPMTQGEHMRLHGFGGDANVGQALKTHCPAGHPYDDENTYHWRGERQCRICRLEASRRSRARGNK